MQENAELKKEVEQVMANMEIVRGEAKENATVFIQQSEKETTTLYCKGLKEDIARKDKEASFHLLTCRSLL